MSALHATPPTSEGAIVPEAGPQTPAAPALVAVAVVAGDGDPLLPCGRCRQLLLEAGGPALLVDTAAGPLPLAELLPAAFGGADLSRRDDPGTGHRPGNWPLTRCKPGNRRATRNAGCRITDTGKA